MKPALLCFLMFVYIAPASHAGLDLGWDNCVSDGGAIETSFDCNGSATGQHELYGTFQLNNDMPQFIAFDFVIDVVTETGPSSDFWQFGTGECNSGYLTLSDGRLGDCTSAASTMCFVTGGRCESGYAWASNVGTFGCFPPRSHSRFVGSIFRDATQPVSLVSGTDYFAFKFTFFTNAATESGGACDGCTEGVAIIWQSALASGFTGTGTAAEAQEEPINGPGLVTNCVGINHWFNPCGATPTKNRTWGQVKSLYR